jgi:hypothetical protein
MNPDRAVPAKIEPVSRPDSSTGSFNAADVDAQFRYEESTLLLRASDGSERLNRLHEQLNMLPAPHSARLR